MNQGRFVYNASPSKSSFVRHITLDDYGFLFWKFDDDRSGQINCDEFLEVLLEAENAVSYFLLCATASSSPSTRRTLAVPNS